MPVLGSASTLLQKGLLDLKNKTTKKHRPFTGEVTHACHHRGRDEGISAWWVGRPISARLLKVILLEQFSMHKAYIVSLLPANIGMVYLFELISIDLFLLTKVPTSFRLS